MLGHITHILHILSSTHLKGKYSHQKLNSYTLVLLHMNGSFKTYGDFFETEFFRSCNVTLFLLICSIYVRET